MSKPSIINLSFSTAWGGLEMSSVKWTRLFHQAGYPSLEVCQPATPIEKALNEQGLDHLSLPVKNYVSPMATLELRRLIKQRNAKAVFLHSMKDIWLVTPALLGMKEVKLFGFARMFFKDISKKDLGHTLMYSRLNRMIALSEIQKRHLQNCLPVPEEKFVVVPNGVDTQKFAPRPRREDIRASWGVRPEQLLFGLIGRLDRQKGSVEFVEAAGEVLKHHSHARFVMVGGNTLGESDIGREVTRRLGELGLNGKVILTDFRNDVPEVMNALDVFVMPSYEENFANVLLEALASGLACIGTDSGGTPEILSFGEVGKLCEPRSHRALASAMDGMIRHENLRRTMADRAREKALREYEMSAVFKRIELLVN
jgi:glycosyltransferase involved in cell wall biosynthesis